MDSDTIQMPGECDYSQCGAQPTEAEEHGDRNLKELVGFRPQSGGRGGMKPALSSVSPFTQAETLT